MCVCSNHFLTKLLHVCLKGDAIIHVCITPPIEPPLFQRYATIQKGLYYPNA